MCSAASRRFGLLFSLALVVVSLISIAAAQAPATEAPASLPLATTASPSAQEGAPANGQMPQASAAQDPGPQESIANDQGTTFVFKKQVQEVILHATVVDEQRHLVPALDRNAFAVFDNGTPQAITSFRREDVPVAMGIVVDNSGSMRDKRNEVNQAVLNLIRASNPDDEIFVVNFSQSYYLDQDFTSDVNLLQTALHQVSSTGSTALYDAIVASAVHLNNNRRLDKKVLLVITDGQDNMSQETLQEAMRRVQQPNGPIVYAVGLTGIGLEGPGRQALQTLAEGTGGVAYFPDTLDQVENITRTVAHDIRSQYLIVYKPKNQDSKPGYQAVHVEASAAGYGKLIVRTKNGYFPRESAR
jgi:Ca-activated chloride channel family protein